MLPLDNVYAAVDRDYTPVLRDEASTFNSEIESSTFPPDVEQATYGVRATGQQSLVRGKEGANTINGDDEVSSFS